MKVRPLLAGATIDLVGDQDVAVKVVALERAHKPGSDLCVLDREVHLNLVLDLIHSEIKVVLVFFVLLHDQLDGVLPRAVGKDDAGAAAAEPGRGDELVTTVKLW